MTSTNTTRAAIYLRISNDKTGEELGVTRQREDALSVCARNNWTPVEYQDNDRSGVAVCEETPAPVRADDRSTSKRARSKPSSCTKPTGCTANRKEGEEFIDLAERLGVALVTLTGRFDLSTAEGRLMYRQFCSFAAYESEVKSERQLRAARQKAGGVCRSGRTRSGTSVRVM